MSSNKVILEEGSPDRPWKGTDGRGQVIPYLYDSGSMSYVVATGGSGTGSQVEVTNQPTTILSEINSGVNGPFAVPASADYFSRSVASNVETIVYKSGGAGGTTLKTITVTYTDSTLSELTSAAVS